MLAYHTVDGVRFAGILNIMDDDGADVFGDAGLDYEELEIMDPIRRRDVLREAGLDPDKFDF